MKPRLATSQTHTRWERLMAAHAEAARAYRAASARAAIAEADACAFEDAADDALRAMAELEDKALAMPADGAASLRFKLALWGACRVEEQDAEWRILAEDCERLLADGADLRRQA